MDRLKNNKSTAVLAVLLVVTIITTLALVLPQTGEYTFYARGDDLQVTDVVLKNPNVVEVVSQGTDDGYAHVTFRAKAPGDTDVDVIMHWPEGKYERLMSIHVNSVGMVIGTRQGLAFNGWQTLLLGSTIAFALLAALLLKQYAKRIKTDLYSYGTLKLGGLGIMVALYFGLFLILCFMVLPRFRDYDPSLVLSVFTLSFVFFVLAAIPFVIVFSIALGISNIRLIQKEGLRPVNLLGIALGVAMTIAMIACMSPVFMPIEFFGNFYHVVSRAQIVVCAVFIFMLTFMLSTMICGLIAARRVPALDQDFIIILGCAIKKDGTLFPLLQGRVDRAVWLWRQQQEATGKQAVFVPSGGQGSDEVISEGEAMARYLRGLGVPDELIMPETESANTLQNMQFSKRLIDARKPDAKVAFSTTNYHVFRSGIFAEQAGLKATGIGSKAPWYFWPNAFVREFAGLMASAWKLELAFFGIIIVLVSALVIAT